MGPKTLKWSTFVFMNNVKPLRRQEVWDSLEQIVVTHVVSVEDPCSQHWTFKAAL